MTPLELEDICETIDAALFTGDTFEDPACVKMLREYMARWTRNLPNEEVTP